MTKQCTKCKKWKSYSLFSKQNRRGREGFSSHCKQCVANDYRKYSIKKYGISVEEYDRMVKAQNNRCAICYSLPEKGRLAIDHCHKTGKVRSLLCTSCNVAVGMVAENIELAERIISYLIKDKGPPIEKLI